MFKAVNMSYCVFTGDTYFVSKLAPFDRILRKSKIEVTLCEVGSLPLLQPQILTKAFLISSSFQRVFLSIQWLRFLICFNLLLAFLTAVLCLAWQNIPLWRTRLLKSPSNSFFAVSLLHNIFFKHSAYIQFYYIGTKLADFWQVFIQLLALGCNSLSQIGGCFSFLSNYRLRKPFFLYPDFLQRSSTLPMKLTPSFTFKASGLSTAASFNASSLIVDSSLWWQKSNHSN